MAPRRVLTIVAILSVGFLSSLCGGDEGPVQPPIEPTENTIDSIPPAAISDLFTKHPTADAVFLVWTAPGDDGDEGTAVSYDIRYHIELITDQNWDTATQFDGEPAPKPGRQLETVKVDGLDAVTTYYFAIKTTDDEGNISGLSNSVYSTTLQETTPPVNVADLSAVAVDDNTFLLMWTAPGDDGIDGTASEYQIRYSEDPISEARWPYTDEIFSPPPAPKPGGEPESLLVTKMRPMLSYYFVMRAADEVPNWSGLSNNAYAMGYSLYLEISDQIVDVGQQVTIYFRAPGNSPVTLLLRRFSLWSCDPSHPNVVDCIILDTRYEKGIYELSYDFTSDDGYYFPSDIYYLGLCWQYELQSTRRIYFGVSP